MFERSVWAHTALMLRRLLRHPRLYLVAALMGLIMDTYIGGVRQLAGRFAVRVSAFGSFAGMTSFSYLMLWMALGYLVLVSDAPFAHRLTVFAHLRVSPRQALAARILYVVLTAVLYVLLMFVISAALQLASFAHPLLWDKVLKTMSYRQSVEGVLLYMPQTIIQAYTPLGAWAAAVGLLACALACAGLLLLLGAFLADKRLVMGLLVMLVCLDSAIGYMSLPEWLYYASPFSWCRLEVLQTRGYFSRTPGAAYCALMLFGLLLALCGLGALMLRRPGKINEKLIMLGGACDD